MTIKLGDPAGANRDSVRDMLRTICGDADLQVAADGTVTTNDADFCDDLEAQIAGGEGEGEEEEAPPAEPPAPAPPAAPPAVATVEACKCICEAIRGGDNGKTITIEINNNLRAAGGGKTTDDVPDDTANGNGSDETVEIENQDRWRVRRKDNNQWVDEPDWIILAHELCGHAVPGVNGTHPEWRPGKPGYRRNWHDEAFDREDTIRDQAGLPEIGGAHSPSVKPGN